VRVATWNVNDIRKRLPQLLDWLQRTAPDVVALQELKAPTADFPVAALAAAGYAALVVGQRTWNGVALLARGQEPLAVSTALPGDAKDKEARYVEAAIDGVLFACLYLPNGNPCPGPKFDYKLRWFERLQARAAQLQAAGQPVVLLGDWNVVPTDADIYKPDTWRDNALLQAEPRAAFARLLSQGWTDALAHAHPQARPFTFWDYRRNRWQRDAGLRIDHILVNARLAIADAGVDRDERGADNPSDHAPAWAEIAVAATKPARSSATRKTAAAPDPLARYRSKRDFAQTPEPAGELVPARAAAGERPRFVVQKHWASRLHYDFRLELDGVMASWAIPKGPSLDPAARPIAIQVEDHPLAYGDFEGTIPKGQYGAGRVIVWDRGAWAPVGDPRGGLAAGKLVFRLHGHKLAGLWELVRISKPDAARQDEWLLLKKRGDAWARPAGDYDVITALPDSVIARPLGLLEERTTQGAAGARPTDDLARAVDADLPARLSPQLATAAASVPAGAWLCETKLDGYRLLARIEGASIRLFTRAGNDWTSKFKPVVQALKGLGLTKTWLDGEIVVMNERGIPDFNRLQNAIDNARTADVQYFLFDAPHFEGKDMRRVPLRSRRAVLAEWLEAHPRDGIRFSESFEAAPMDMLAAARQLGLEGVMVKRADSPYEECRTATWLKLKCQQRQEFVVIGFTDRSDRTTEVGSLLLAYYEGDALRFAGSVGAGWDAAAGTDLHRRLSSLATDQPAIDPATINVGKWSRRGPGAERWVRPTTVVEVRFADWTADGHIRHAVFRGVREDKPPREVGRETRAPAAGRDAAAPPAAVDAAPAPGLKITHPERVIDASTGLRKIDLVRYYASIAPWMLPHLENRPVSLVRAPQGVAGPLFFQKHPESKVPGLTELDPALWPDHPALLAVNSADSLVAAAQLNTIEFHGWNSTTRRIALPDRFILDLDPGEGVSWKMLQEAALLTRAMLTELGLESWLKTSGGKGLHVVVPLTPKDDYEAVKDFSHAVVRHMAKVIPTRFVAVAGGGHRVGKVFIDYLRNGHGQTTACAFSARSRPGLGVSMPVGWEQLGELKASAQWTVATAREYVSFQSVDPWAGYWKKRQTLAAGRKVLAAAGRR
jgi:bifunctional non-homologous end joining protein LigD